MLIALYLAGALAGTDPVVVSGVDPRAATPQSQRYEGQCGQRSLELAQWSTKTPALTIDSKPVALSPQAQAFLNVRGAAYRTYSRCTGDSFKLVVARAAWEEGKGETYAVYGAQVAAGGLSQERVETADASAFFYR